MSSPEFNDIANDIAAVGETVTLRRLAQQDIHFDVTLPAVITAYAVQDLTTEIAQGDQRVIISNRDILARQWPGPPRKNDVVLFSEGQVTVEGVVTNKIGNEIVSHVLQVRG